MHSPLLTARAQKIWVRPGGGGVEWQEEAYAGLQGPRLGGLE